MVELVVIACLISNPQACEAMALPFQEPMGAVACVRTGQFRVVEWAQSHPGWRVRRWRCELPGA